MDIPSLYRLKSKFVARAVGDELIIVPITGNIAQMSELFTLNETAKMIWESIDEKSTIDDIQQKLTDTFDIDAQTVRNDIEAFVDRVEGMLNK